MAASSVTVLDGLRKEFSNIAQLKLSPDAQQHGQFIDGLMAAIQQYIGQTAQATIGGGAGQPGGQPGQAPQSPLGGGGAGGPMGTPMAAGAVAPNQIGPGGGPGMAGLAQPPGNMDEIRRMLTGSVNV